MRSRISRAALLVKVTARISDGQARRVAMMCARRAVSAAVLPVPAPASISTGPSVVSTACRCGPFNPCSSGGSEGYGGGMGGGEAGWLFTRERLGNSAGAVQCGAQRVGLVRRGEPVQFVEGYERHGAAGGKQGGGVGGQPLDMPADGAGIAAQTGAG